MKLYKLTDENNMTFNQTLWGENITHTAPGIADMCTSGWIHAYESPLLAVLMNPIHADFSLPQLWEAEGDIGISDGTKCGVKQLTTLHKIPLPEITLTQRVAFGILCSLKVYTSNYFEKWGRQWLNGKDRSGKSARVADYTVGYTADYTADYAARAARAANYAAVYAVARAADYTFTDYAARAVDHAARAADYAAVYTADYAARAAVYTARAAVYTAEVKTNSVRPINFVVLAEEAMQY